MGTFENYEKWDMLQAFVESGKNSINALNLYYTRYPERRQPHTSIFRRLEQNVINFGSFEKPRTKLYNKPNKENEVINVLGFVEADPATSSREI